MLRTRLFVGTILAVLAAGMLLIDERFAPWYYFLLAIVLFLSSFGAVELLHLIPEPRRPNRTLCIVGVVLLVMLNWAPIVTEHYDNGPLLSRTSSSNWVFQGFAGFVLAAFLTEMATFRAPGRSVERIALAVWVAAYLGVLPGFLVRLRTDGAGLDAEAVRRGSVALALAIFVPKGCDIGAYFTGRFLGRHRMTPVLSPKKTWEGAAGGLAGAVGVAFALDRLGPVIPGGTVGTVAFGLTVGVAGMLGDLAESLIKRDCEQKDASQVVPGFGGILDVVDAIVFAAPVAYWWLH